MVMMLVMMMMVMMMMVMMKIILTLIFPSKSRSTRFNFSLACNGPEERIKDQLTLAVGLDRFSCIRGGGKWFRVERQYLDHDDHYSDHHNHDHYHQFDDHCDHLSKEEVMGI